MIKSKGWRKHKGKGKRFSGGRMILEVEIRKGRQLLLCVYLS